MIKKLLNFLSLVLVGFFVLSPIQNIFASQFTKKIDLSSTIGAYPQGSLTFKDGIFYGLTSGGGIGISGTIFSWDPDTNTYAKKVDLDSAKGRNPQKTNLTLKDNIFYGLTYSGGVNNAGTIFSWDPASFSPIISLGDKTEDIFSATLEINIENNGNSTITTIGAEYGLTDSYGDNETLVGSYPEGFSNIEVSSLECETQYHYRLFATNEFGTTYTSDDTFTTGDCPPSTTDILYAIDGGGSNSNPPNLYKINSNTGRILETIGPVGFHVTGLAFHPSTKVLYGSTGNNDPVGDNNSTSLVTVNKDTGAGTLLGVIKDSDDEVRSMADISFKSDGTLYGWSPQGKDLYTIDTSSCDGSVCLATKVGESGLDTYGNGLAFDSNDNLFLLGDGDNSFWQIDPDTGLSLENTPLSNTLGYNIGSAAFSKENNLYAVRHTYDLIVVDVLTGEIISLDTNEDMNYIDAMAFLSVPTVPSPTITPTQSHSTIPLAILQRLSDQLTGRNSASDCLPTHNFSSSTGLPCPSNTNINNTVTNYKFLKNLKYKDIEEDVKLLQQYLNSKGFTVSQVGPGSQGKETTFFGTKTKQALILFQKANNIYPTLGFFGPLTRGFINR